MKQDPDYTIFAAEYATRDRKTTPQEIEFLNKIFRKNEIKRVLDVACGTGRLTFLLDRLGYHMAGVDLSSKFIKMNKREAKTRGRNIKFSIEDMRRLRKHGTFDAAICMWGSFTYLESIDDMLNALKGMNKNLKKGGTLIIDVAPGWHEIVISKKYKLKMHDKPVKNGKVCRTDVTLDPADQFSLQHDEYILYSDGKIKAKAYFDRKRYHFTPSLFDLLLKLSGFKVESFYSDRDIRKKLPQNELKRLIVVAKKI